MATLLEDVMPLFSFRPTGWLGRMWQASAPLTGTGLLMLPLLAAAIVGLWLDPRIITGAPAWLKPAKFAASIAVYTLTLAWACTYLPGWVRTRRAVGWITAVTLVVEIIIIGAQAWRGTTSHFNVGTPLDAALFSVMGAAILVQTLSSVAIAVAVWRQRFADRALGWSLRLGMALTIVGAFSGGLMVRPTDAQLDEARSARMTVAGAHTVGAPDGGAGLPGTGWSLEHGDLRIPHFLGLHAIQLLPLLAAGLPRRWPQTRRTRTVAVSAGSYAALFVILVRQAFNGESIAAPAPLTLTILAAWVTATAGGLYLTSFRRYAPRSRASSARARLAEREAASATR
jgi:hypothetical protein